MESREPALKPEWLFRTAGSNGRPGTSLPSDEHGRGANSSRSRQSGHGRGSDRDRDRSSNSSSKKSSGSGGNGSRKQDKDGAGKSRGYGSFGRSNRERVREKDSLDFHGQDNWSLALPNDVFRDSLGPFFPDDRMRRTHSLSRHSHTNNARQPMTNGLSLRRSVTGVTFEREFPLLGAEEDKKNEIERVPSPGLSSPAKSLSPVTVPNGCSNQVRVPNGANNGLVTPSVSQAVSTNQGLEASSVPTSLNMAKTLAQAPSRAHVSQSSIDSQLIEERNRKQCQSLIPLTPLASKISGSNPSEKFRVKGLNSTASLRAAPSSTQLAASAARGPTRSEVLKPTHQGGLQDLKQNGGFQDLKLNISSAAKDSSSSSKPLSPSTRASSAASLPLKSSVNQKRGLLMFSPQVSFGERKSRQDFFNTLRNKPSNGNGSSDASESVCLSIAANLAEPEDKSAAVTNEADGNMSDFGHKPLENGSCTQEEFYFTEHNNQASLPGKEEADICSDSNFGLDLVDSNLYSPPLDPEEEKFLLSLGWNENEEVPALTPEEIEAFKNQHPNMSKKAISELEGVGEGEKDIYSPL